MYLQTKPEGNKMITTVISSELFDANTMILVSAADHDDDLWTVQMPEEIYERTAMNYDETCVCGTSEICHVHES